MKKILIADDNPDNVFLVKSTLKANGYEVITATDGLSAVTEAAAQKPDLIVLDMMMPNLSGADTAKMLQKDPATAGIPIIFLSALLPKQEHNEPTKTMDIVGRSYVVLAKPLDPHRLLAQIKQLI